MQVHLEFVYKLQWATLNQMHQWILTEKDRQSLEWTRNFLNAFGKRAYLNFALIPFSLGLLLNVLRRRSTPKR